MNIALNAALGMHASFDMSNDLIADVRLVIADQVQLGVSTHQIDFLMGLMRPQNNLGFDLIDIQEV